MYVCMSAKVIISVFKEFILAGGNFFSFLNFFVEICLKYFFGNIFFQNFFFKTFFSIFFLQLLGWTREESQCGGSRHSTASTPRSRQSRG